jgi:hypothetical protein
MITILLCLKQIRIKVPKFILFEIIFAAGQDYCYGPEPVKNRDINIIFWGACRYGNLSLFEWAIKNGANGFTHGLFIARVYFLPQAKKKRIYRACKNIN